MSFTLAATLAASMTLPSCSWDRPGANPFMGDVVAAVDRYTDIPEPVRAKLKARMEARQYDEIAAIRRDSITGKRKYGSEIRDMHFGQGQVCSTVTRAKWADDAVERGLVYCESGHCILVPTVCRNVSRITRLGSERVASAGDDHFPVAGDGVARAGAGPGGASGSGLPDGSDSAIVALATAPDSETSAGGAAGDASFQSTSGRPTLSVSALEFGGSASSWVAAAAGGDVGFGFPRMTGAGLGGISMGPSAGAGAVGSTVASGPAIAGTSGLNADGFGSAPALSGLGGSDSLGSGWAPSPPVGTGVPQLSPVPEPGTWLLGLLGLVGVAVAARRR